MALPVMPIKICLHVFRFMGYFGLKKAQRVKRSWRELMEDSRLDRVAFRDSFNMAALSIAILPNSNRLHPILERLQWEIESPSSSSRVLQLPKPLRRLLSTADRFHRSHQPPHERNGDLSSSQKLSNVFRQFDRSQDVARGLSRRISQP